MTSLAVTMKGQVAPLARQGLSARVPKASRASDESS